jgi:hypothetical protein
VTPRRVALAGVTGLAGLAGLAACAGGEVTSPSDAHVVAEMRATQLAVGDTMTVRAGVRFPDGRFVPLDDYSVTSLDTLTLVVRAGTTTVEARRAGAGRLRVALPALETTLDTTVAVVGAR